MSEERYRFTSQGYELIWNWVRLTSQVCEMEHEGDCNDLDHEVSFLLAMILPTFDEAVEGGMFE